jgi:methionyl-tRNA synthetase
MKNRILVTSALPYANGPLHIGHIAGAYLPADIYVRYNRMKNNDIIFIGGSDEHGVPITITAEKEKVSPQVIIDRFHEMNKQTFSELGISFDNYSRTSLEIHHKTAQEVFLEIEKNGHLEEKEIQQFYCNKCSMFLADRYIEGICPHCGDDGARGDQCEKCGKWIEPTDLKEPKCKLCGSTPELKTTKHWFLQMGKFQQKIEEWIKSKNWKDNVMNFCKGWFIEGLGERAITRDISWGIKVPIKEAEGKVLYVWFEAPIGYISSTKEWAEKKGNPDLWKDYWRNENCKIVHFIGKDNIVFHAIVWPIVLMASDYANLPDEIPANEFLNISSRKISTSRNFAIWVKDFIKEFQPDSLRYALAINAPESRDTDFTWEYFQERHNNELADTIGNFVNRAIIFIKRFFDSKVPVYDSLSSESENIILKVKEIRNQMDECFSNFKVKEATRLFMQLAKECNKFFNDSAPWHSFKSDKDKCAADLFVSINLVKWIAQLMHPIMPFTSEKIWKFLNLTDKCENSGWDKIGEEFMESGFEIGNAEILFTKISDKEIEVQNQKLLGNSGSAAAESQENAAVVELADISDFAKIKLKVAEILEAENIPKSKKLLKLQIKVGEEKRQIIAGIAEYYSPEKLIGKKIVIVSNLKPAKIFGNESRGMLLAAKINNKLTLVCPETDIESGADVG